MAKTSLAAIPETPETSTSSASIKDAYSEWLRDVDVLTRKRKGKKKSKRLAALRHLAQPTESSAKKQFLAPVADDVRRAVVVNSEDASASQEEALRRRFQSLADEASYAHFSYEPPWSPGLPFFALLATYADSSGASAVGNQRGVVTRREIPNFPVQVPPTILRLARQSQGVVLLLTVEQQDHGQDGEAPKKPGRNLPTSDASWRKDVAELGWTLQFHFFTKQETFESRLPWILHVLTSTVSDASIVAVLKTSSERGNRVQALESPPATEDALRSLWDLENSTTGVWRAVQAYVPSKGTTGSGIGKAWIARPAYRKRDQSAATVWILTGSTGLFASTEWDLDAASTSQPCHIVKCTTAQSWQAPRILSETLCQCLDTRVLRPSGVGSFAELVVDLVQDARGCWWLLQIKAFQLRRAQLPPALAANGDSSSRARSAPDRLETMSIVSTSTRVSGVHLSKTKWKCAGKYCHYDTSEMYQEDDDNNNNPVQRDAPSGFLTKKELLSCEFYDKFRASDDASLSGGCGSFASALLFYLQHQVSKRERTVLYEPQALCGSCIRQYYALRSGMDSLESSISSGQATSKKPQLSRVAKSSKLVASKSLAALPAAVANTTKLPALSPSPYLSLPASQSTPELLSQAVGHSAPSYMDELERIEQLLADGVHARKQQHQCEQPSSPQPPARSTTKKTKDATLATEPRVDVTPKVTAKPMTFSWQQTATRGDRVEEMWQSIRPKALAPSFASLSSSCANVSTASRAYNSFSLENALRDTSLSATLQTHKPPEAPHLISIVDCRRVVSDDAFRESLVRETVQRLLGPRQPVQFVVLPADEDEPAEGGDALALGRMALRTLALDVDQSLAQEGVPVTRGLPAVDGDAAGSGCLFMTVPVPTAQTQL